MKPPAHATLALVDKARAPGSFGFRSALLHEIAAGGPGVVPYLLTLVLEPREELAQAAALAEHGLSLFEFITEVERYPPVRKLPDAREEHGLPAAELGAAGRS